MNNDLFDYFNNKVNKLSYENKKSQIAFHYLAIFIINPYQFTALYAHITINIADRTM